MNDLYKVSENELYDILCRYAKEEETDDDESKLIFYIFTEFIDRGIEPSAEEILAEMEQLVMSHILKELVNADILDVLIDEDGEETYEPTKKAEHYISDM